MKHLFHVLSLFLGLQAIQAQDVYKPLENGLLWKIEGKELKKASYLFGTIHLIPATEFFLPKNLEKSLQETQKVFMEVDIDGMNDMGNLMSVGDKLFMQNDTSLVDLISPEEYKQLDTFFNNLGIPLNFFELLKPMFLSVLVGSQGNPFGLQDGSLKSYEFELAELAKKYHIETDGLESLDFQISIFDNIPYGVQAKMLMASFKSAQADEQVMQEMYQKYKSQNLEALGETITKEDEPLSDHLDLLLYKRNLNWIPKMETEMQKASCFFAVGAGHLAGERGVIHLLRKAGYRVEQVN